MLQNSKRCLFYSLVPSFIGEMGIVWRETERSMAVIHILFPNRTYAMAEHIRLLCPDAVYKSTAESDRFCRYLQDLPDGAPGRFSLALLDLEQCYEFQKRVLMKAREIPRGMVVSYGRLAELIGAPRAARAVGTALAKNPFPLILPCHRVIKSTGYLGQFGGGTDLKKTLLEHEGVCFEGQYHVKSSCFWAGRHASSPRASGDSLYKGC